MMCQHNIESKFDQLTLICLTFFPLKFENRLKAHIYLLKKTKNKEN